VVVNKEDDLVTVLRSIIGMNPAFTSPKRRVSLDTDFTLCIVCQTSSDDEINTLTRRGFPTFKNALETRQDDVYERLWTLVQDTDEYLAKKPKCHRTCRSNYTHKRELEKQVSKCSKSQELDEDIASGSANRSDIYRRSSAVNLKKCCFICEKERDAKGVWKLILVATEPRQKAIYEQAMKIQDQAILLKIHGIGNRDMVAADFRYHKSCMDTFMNRRETKCIMPVNQGDPYENAFGKLLLEITDTLLKDQSEFYITQLRDKYREMLTEEGVANAESYRTDRLRKRLLDHFGSSIQILPQRGKASLVCSSDIKVSEMCALVTSLQQQLDDSELKTESDCSEDEESGNVTLTVHNDSYAIAKHLQREMKESAKAQRGKLKEEGPSPASDEPECSASAELEISYEEASKRIPNDLYNHLAWMIQ